MADVKGTNDEPAGRIYLEEPRRRWRDYGIKETRVIWQ